MSLKVLAAALLKIVTGDDIIETDYDGPKGPSTRTGDKVAPLAFRRGSRVITAQQMEILRQNDPTLARTIDYAAYDVEAWYNCEMVCHTWKNHYRLSKQKQKYEAALRWRHAVDAGTIAPDSTPDLEDATPLNIKYAGESIGPKPETSPFTRGGSIGVQAELEL